MLPRGWGSACCMHPSKLCVGCCSHASSCLSRAPTAVFKCGFPTAHLAILLRVHPPSLLPLRPPLPLPSTNDNATTAAAAARGPNGAISGPINGAVYATPAAAGANPGPEVGVNHHVYETGSLIAPASAPGYSSYSELAAQAGQEYAVSRPGPQQHGFDGTATNVAAEQHVYATPSRASSSEGTAVSGYEHLAGGGQPAVSAGPRPAAGEYSVLQRSQYDHLQAERSAEPSAPGIPPPPPLISQQRQLGTGGGSGVINRGA